MSSPQEPAKNPSPNARPPRKSDIPEPPQSNSQGHVFLVGAGPGDPSLITLKGVRCLQSADVVLYDYLANSELLGHAPSESEKICLGGHSIGRLWTQDQINAAMIDHAQSGRTVVRLKGGDPSVFGCGVQEMTALLEAGVTYEIIPGISAGIAAAAFGGIPITHSDTASAVAFVTGQERKGKPSSNLDFAAMASFPGTLIVYMGTTTVVNWSRKLIEAGKPPETPVAIVRRASLPDQKVFETSLGEVGALVRRDPPIRPPVVFVIGEVVAERQRFDWCANRSLFGQLILNPRSVQQAPELTDYLRLQGAGVITQPAIEIHPHVDPESWEAILSPTTPIRWLVFSSVNGVNGFMAGLKAMNRDMRAFPEARLAAVGPATAEALESCHLHVDQIAWPYRAEGLIDALKDQVDQQRVVLVRGTRGRDVLPEGLESAGAKVESICTYESRDATIANPRVLESMRQGDIHWVAVTSSAIARSLAQQYGEALRQTRLASISSLTSEALRELGYEPSAEAKEATLPALVDAIVQAS